MAIIQIYETTILEHESDCGLGLLVVPARSMPMNELRATPAELLERLDLEMGERVSPRDVVKAIAALLWGQMDRGHPLEIYSALLDRDMGGIIGDRAVIQFAEEASFARLVPFEQSPIDLESIVSLFTKASSTSGVALGAYAGWAVAGPTPLLFVSVTGGMLLFGAAAGIASALQEGLRYRFLRWLKGSDS